MGDGNINNSNKSIKTSDVNKQFKKDEHTSIQIGQMQEYAMFFKMIKLGIPKDAIKQKMRLANVDERFLDYPDTTPYVTVIHYISNPKLGPYIKPPNNNNDNNDNNYNNNDNNTLKNENKNENEKTNKIVKSPMQNMMNINLLSSISGGIKLKKVVRNDDDDTNNKNKILDNIIKNNSKHNNSNMKVPSLSDIQGALSKLKKITIDC
jgi:hypothetical protein